ncbi:MAG: hypothetical protein J6T47_07450 [Lachnospiraceae bacterium]|nr:hypothetical protein [Lachnospiraceae bacterium]
MEKMVICSSCGAEFDSEQVRCPYCGTGYAPAEEKEYIGQLDDIREELASHVDDGTKRVKHGVGRVLILTVVVVAVIVAIILGGLSLSKKGERDRADRNKEEFLNKQGITLQSEEEVEK